MSAKRRPSHGGPRPGSGRPPLPPEDVPEAILLRVHPIAAARFRAYCASRNLSQRAAFEAWARRLPRS